MWKGDGRRGIEIWMGEGEGEKGMDRDREGEGDVLDLPVVGFEVGDHCVEALFTR